MNSFNKSSWRMQILVNFFLIKKGYIFSWGKNIDMDGHKTVSQICLTISESYGKLLIHGREGNTNLKLAAVCKGSQTTCEMYMPDTTSEQQHVEVPLYNTIKPKIYWTQDSEPILDNRSFASDKKSYLLIHILRAYGQDALSMDKRTHTHTHTTLSHN